MLKEQHWKYVLEVQPGGEEVEVKKETKMRLITYNLDRHRNEEWSQKKKELKWNEQITVDRKNGNRSWPFLTP